MALINCPECGREVSDKALMCPHCGLGMGGGLFGYEFRSKATFFGLPLLHVVRGGACDPATGRLRVAKGIIAIGPIAVGGLAVGGVSIGGLALGGLSLGLLALGGLSIGLLLAFGGLAVGLVAVGGAALGYYALGGAAGGVHALGANARDAEAIQFFRRWLGPWVEKGLPPA